MAGTDRPEVQGVPADEARSLGELFSSATRDMSTLVRAEIELAKREIKKDVVTAATGGGLFGAAAVCAFFAVPFLSVAAAYGIHALGLALGWSFLIVAGVYLVLAAVAVFLGIKAFKKVGPPERTIRTTKDTVTALKGVKSVV